MVKRVAAKDSERPKAASGEGARSSTRAGARRARGSAPRAQAAHDLHTGEPAVEGLPESMLARGRDALSSDAGGVAAAVAVGLGAALLEAELLPGILLGAGAMLLGRVFPQLNEGMRPLLKSVVGAGLTVADKTRAVLAEAGEQVQDVVAEVKAERQQPRTARRAARHDRPAEHDEIHARGVVTH